jgi:molecular chaperone HtpG
MDDTEKLMPKYLRFIRGLVDSNDLPLNVSREILQDNKVIEAIKNGSVKKVLGMLEKIAKKDKTHYQQVWDQFGQVIKEGPAEDHTNKEKILGLMRFASTDKDEDVQNVSLDDYIARMKAEQDKIYYITAENFATAKNSPHLEILRKKGLEVLLMSDRVDEWMMSFIQDYKDKKFVSVAKGNLDLGDLETEEDKKEQEKAEKSASKIVERLKEALADKVDEVKVSTRLTSSPACLVTNEQDMAMHMQQILKQAGQTIPSSKPVLEINPDHPVMKKVEAATDEQFKNWTNLIYDQCVLAEGGQLEDPASFVKSMNEMLLAMSK